MMAGSFFIFRIALAWLVTYVFVCISMAGLVFQFRGPDGGLLVAFGFLMISFVILRAVGHLRRVRLIAEVIDGAALSNRHRRNIELPFGAAEVFDMLDAAVRGLPGRLVVDSSRAGLRVRANVTQAPLRADANPSAADQPRPATMRANRVVATVASRGDMSSVTLICEPERPVWSDAFWLDDGSNLENIEAVSRALAHRVGQHRRDEKESLRQTATEKELSVARLNLLQAQVEPHFLYNTLASAQLLTRSDPPGADAMLGNLIVYLRHSLPKAGDGLSSIGTELERARAYLDIAKIRMGERLSLRIEAPDGVTGAGFPAMMLQTLVENAIKHGLEPKSGGGTVWIQVRSAGASLVVTVADDGRGFCAGSGGTGIGLHNVRERLRLMYGEAATFVIGENFPVGVAATITVPLSGAVVVHEAVTHD